jgi:hypothetical protein
MMQIFRNTVPQLFENDNTYLFHGTSNISESNLDKSFSKTDSFISFEIIDKIIAVYQSLNWSGKHGGGYAVLNSFSIADKNKNGKYFL